MHTGCSRHARKQRSPICPLHRRSSSRSAGGRRAPPHRRAGAGGSQPGLFWLGGFRSDMAGSKALAVDDWAAAHGRACVRFDYSGHGESGGGFSRHHHPLAGGGAGGVRTTPRAADAVGSSMGGWLACCWPGR